MFVYKGSGSCVIPHDCWIQVISNLGSFRDFISILIAVKDLWGYIIKVGKNSGYNHKIKIIPKTKKEFVNKIKVSGNCLKRNAQDNLNDIFERFPNLREIFIDSILDSKTIRRVSNDRIVNFGMETCGDLILNLDLPSLRNLNLQTTNDGKTLDVNFRSLLNEDDSEKSKFSSLRLSGWKVQTSIEPLKRKLTKLYLHRVDLCKRSDLHNMIHLRTLTLSGVSLLSKMMSLEAHDFPVLENLKILITKSQQDQIDRGRCVFNGKRLIGFEEIKKFKQLRTLHIDLGIKCRGCSILKITDLEKLHLLQASHVDLKIGNLERIKVLRSKKCRLIFEDNTITCVSTLEHLVIEESQIGEHIITSISSILKDLKTLYISGALELYSSQQQHHSKRVHKTVSLSFHKMPKLQDLRIICGMKKNDEGTRFEDEGPMIVDYYVQNISNCLLLKNVEITPIYQNNASVTLSPLPLCSSYTELPSLESLKLRLSNMKKFVKYTQNMIENTFLFLGWSTPNLKKLVIHNDDYRTRKLDFDICYNEFFLNDIEEIELSGFGDVKINGKTVFSELKKITIVGNHFKNLHISNHPYLKEINLQLLKEEEKDEKELKLMNDYFLTVDSLILHGLPKLKKMDLGKVITKQCLLMNLPNCYKLTVNSFLDTQMGFDIRDTEVTNLEVRLYPEDLCDSLSLHHRHQIYTSLPYFIIEEKKFPLLLELDIVFVNDGRFVKHCEKRKEKGLKTKRKDYSCISDNYIIPSGLVKLKYKSIDDLKGLLNLGIIRVHGNVGMERIPFRMVHGIRLENVLVEDKFTKFMEKNAYRRCYSDEDEGENKKESSLFKYVQEYYRGRIRMRSQTMSVDGF